MRHPSKDAGVLGAGVAAPFGHVRLLVPVEDAAGGGESVKVEHAALERVDGIGGKRGSHKLILPSALWGMVPKKCTR